MSLDILAISYHEIENRQNFFLPEFDLILDSLLWTMAATILDKPLGDLRREILDLQQTKVSRDYDLNKLNFLVNNSRDSLGETKRSQQHILQQLQQFEISLAELNQILRANTEEKLQLEQQQQQSGTDQKRIWTFASKNEFVFLSRK